MCTCACVVGVCAAVSVLYELRGMCVHVCAHVWWVCMQCVCYLACEHMCMCVCVVCVHCVCYLVCAHMWIRGSCACSMYVIWCVCTRVRVRWLYMQLYLCLASRVCTCVHMVFHTANMARFTTKCWPSIYSQNHYFFSMVKIYSRLSNAFIFQVSRIFRQVLFLPYYFDFLKHRDKTSLRSEST